MSKVSHDVRKARQGNSGKRKHIKRPVSKDKVKEVIDKASDCDRTLNDPSWYAGSTRLLADAASFPYSFPLGAPVPFDNTSIAKYTVPGIMRFDIMPAVGSSDNTDLTSGVNLASFNIYGFVRHMNSGHANYDAPDLMMYLLAYDQLSMYHAWLKRIYGVARFVSIYNWYLGKALLKSMGVDADDVVANYADLRMAINLFAAQMEMFWVPNSMPLMKRHAYMYQNIYMDDLSNKCQLFYFNPTCFGKYKAMSGDQTYGVLEVVDPYNDFGTGYLKVDTLISIGNSLVSSFITQEDCGIISGDIKKAYNDTGLIHLEAVNEDYTVIPAFVPELLEQIHNLKVLGDPTYVEENNSKLLVKQDVSTNCIYGTYKFPNGYHALLDPGEILFNLHTDSPTPEVSMVASRLTNIVKANDGTLGYHGSEIVTKLQVYTTAANGTGLQSSLVMDTYYEVPLSGTTANTLLGNICKMSNFNYAPLITLDFARTQGAPSVRQFFGNLSTYRVMTYDDVADMHQVAIMSEFGCPITGVYSG